MRSSSLVFAAGTAARSGDLWDEVYEGDRANATVDVVSSMDEVRPEAEKMTVRPPGTSP